MKKNLSFALIVLFLFSFQASQAGEPGQPADPNELLLHATLTQDLATMYECLRGAADPDYQSVRSGHAALHLSIANHHATEMLLMLGANPDIQDFKGKTPLHLAAKRNRIHSACEFLQIGDANPNIQDNMGNAPLHYAIMHNHARLTYLLLKNGALENIPNNLDITAQELAATASPIIQKLFFLKKAARKR